MINKKKLAETIRFRDRLPFIGKRGKPHSIWVEPEPYSLLPGTMSHCSDWGLYPYGRGRQRSTLKTRGGD